MHEARSAVQGDSKLVYGLHGNKGYAMQTCTTQWHDHNIHTCALGRRQLLGAGSALAGTTGCSEQVAWSEEVRLPDRWPPPPPFLSRPIA